MGINNKQTPNLFCINKQPHGYFMNYTNNESQVNIRTFSGLKRKRCRKRFASYY